MKIKKSNYIPAKQHTILTTGEVIKMLRELKGWTQEELAIFCSIGLSLFVRSVIQPFMAEIDCDQNCDQNR